MHSFCYQRGKLYCEGVSVETLAREHGTPLYVYSCQTVARHYQALDHALAPLDHQLCFAMKANSNLAILSLLAKMGSGFDLVSGGELLKAVAAGGDPSKCVFAGVAKTEAELEEALRRGIYSINVESEAELIRINKIAARLKTIAPVAVRINPNVDAHTHAKITTGTYENKFGIQLEQVEDVYARAAKLKHLRLRGIQMHIGSQLTETGPFEQAVKKVLPLVQRLAARHGFEFFSIGGGIGIVYEDALDSGSEAWWKTKAASGILTPDSYARKLIPLLQPLGLKILVEPGRFIAGNSGILVTRVEYIKKTAKKNFVLVDAAMTDLLRPAFYNSYHQIVPVRQQRGPAISSDVAGGICESSDFFCKDRKLSKVAEGDYLALLSAGAYGFTMASNYNTRPLAAEVIVNGKQSFLARKRQPVESIWSLESAPDWKPREL